ncbi:MAG: HAMP domain-containing histidine kinase [Prevotella sp.]|nr:HAMP domain-containing histidine kinase [Prevotella sp.]
MNKRILYLLRVLIFSCCFSLSAMSEPDRKSEELDSLKRELVKTRAESAANKELAENRKNWIIGIVIAFFIIYIMGRRRLTRIIWDKNKKLKVALDRAEGSNRMKTTFINNMSHEIRTPLNAIRGFSSLLCEPGIEISDEEREDAKERISYNVDLITTIVDEVLELANSESEHSVKPDSELSDVMINVLCRKQLRTMENNTNEGVDIRFLTNVADDFTVRTHPSTVNRILTHLIDNAQKFTDKGHIELSCDYDKWRHKVNLIVTDTGTGIKSEDRDRIFGRFEKATDNFKEGIGLGLSISKRLAASLGAEIILDEKYTEGCRFILSIPMKK